MGDGITILVSVKDFIYILTTTTTTEKKKKWNLRRYNHRRTGNFLPGGAVSYLPKNFPQVAQIFMKQ